MIVAKMTQEEKIKYMTTEKVEKLILRMAIPTIFSMLISSFYNMADTYFVGKINNESTAAVGVVFSVMSIIQAIGFFFGQGSGTYVSRQLGKKECDDAQNMAVTGFCFALLFGLIIMVLGVIYTRQIAKLLGAIDSVLPYTIPYLRIIMMGSPFVILSCVLNNQLRFQGSAMFSMLGIVSGAIINIGLDPLFIFKLNLGVSGAAIATVISQMTSFIILLFGTRKGGNIAIDLKKCKPSFFFLKEITKGGMPSLVRQSFASLATIVLNQSIGKYGAAAIAGMSIVQRITMFANSALIGFGQGFQPVCGMNYGAKLYQRVKKGYYFCVKYSTIFLIIVSTLLYIYAPDISRAFRDDDMAIQVATAALRFVCFAFPFNGYIVLANMMLQASGKAFSATLLSMARQGLFFIPYIVVMSKFFGLKGIEMTQMLADYSALLLSIPFVISFLREMKRMSK